MFNPESGNHGSVSYILLMSAFGRIWPHLAAFGRIWPGLANGDYLISQ